MHYVRPVGGGTPTFTISTSPTPLSPNDTVILLNGNMDSLGGADIIGGGDGNDVIFGGGGTDSLDGADGNDTIMGGGGADAYLGGLGDDFFLADANDYAFNNTMDGSEGFDTVSYQLSVRAVSISLGNPGVAIIPPGTNVLDTFVNMEGLIGSRFNDVLQGSDFNNVIEGLEGNDTIDGGLGGLDMISYASVSGNRGVTVNLAVALQNNSAAGVGTDTILNIEGAIGTKNVDTLTGNAFDNIFEGLAGNDVISGGAGNDTASYKSALSALRINLGTQTQSQQGAAIAEVGNDTLVSIENVIGGMGNDTITGTGAANVIDGGPGGNDTLDGGAGIDTVSYENSHNSVIVNLNTTSTIRGVSYTTQAGVGSGIDRLIGFENAIGSIYNDSLIGNTAANVLTGGLGDDSMAGGAGNDMYVIRDAAEHGAAEIINDTGGTDEIRFTQVVAGLTLPASTLTLSDRVTGVERVNIATGTGAVTYSASGVVTGSLDITALNVDASAMTNAPLIIVGNAGANILAGTHSLLGDTLVGGAGNDTYVVSNANDIVLEGTILVTEIDQVNVDFIANGTYTLGNNIENGAIVTADTSLLVNLTGNALANNLLGNAGDNILDGGLGNDNMAGGLGDDTYVINALTDVVVENLNEGNDTIRSSITYSLVPTLQAATGTYSGSSDVENLTLTGTAAINGTGNELDNVITGNTGNNILNGGAGADTLIGGLGNDTYQVDALDVIIENAGEGSDTISTSVTYTLSVGSNIENLTLAGGNNINGTGDAGNNLITGNTGANILNGGGGSDTLVGGAGNDTYIIDDIFDIITELAGGGTDTVQSSLASYTLGANVENLILTGAADSNGLGNTAANRIEGNIGNNSILGDAGNDTLIGGLGADTMQGGTGADRFVMSSSADSTLASRDVIMDFLRGGTTADKIDLSAIDANQVTNGDQAFSATLRANSSANFTAIAQLRYWNDGTNTYVEGNTDNNFATAEFSIQLVGAYGTMSASTNLAVSDFVL
jgi:Ca2+-binding RTX toxin-like protein